MAGEVALLRITSSAFSPGGAIPKKYTCEGENISPPLSISGTPKHVNSLAIIVDDPDAPLGDFVHWVAWNLDPDMTELKEGASLEEEGRNDFEEMGYRGPCPPKGRPHRYFFKVYALDRLIRISKGARKKELLEAMKGHILGQGELIGTFERLVKTFKS